MAGLQKKISMLGAFATGKTSLVRQFVHSIFSDKYHTTVGVKVDRRTVDLGERTVDLLLWDIEGRTERQALSRSYLRGSAGLIYVVDGTRPDTLEQVFELRDMARQTVGDAPSVVALNKSDLEAEWQVGKTEVERLRREDWQVILTSAKTGDGVESAFHWLAAAMTQD